MTTRKIVIDRATSEWRHVTGWNHGNVSSSSTHWVYSETVFNHWTLFLNKSAQFYVFDTILLGYLFAETSRTDFMMQFLGHPVTDVAVSDVQLDSVYEPDVEWRRRGWYFDVNWQLDAGIQRNEFGRSRRDALPLSDHHLRQRPRSAGLVPGAGELRPVADRPRGGTGRGRDVRAGFDYGRRAPPSERTSVEAPLQTDH